MHLGTPEHLELPGLLDLTPAQIDKLLRQTPLHERPMELQGAVRGITGENLDHFFLTLNADVNRTVGLWNAIAPGSAPEPWQCVASDAHGDLSHDYETSQHAAPPYIDEPR